MTDEPDKDDISLSTSDIFKKDQAEDARAKRLAKTETETDKGPDRLAHEDIEAALNKISRDMTTLINHKKRRDEIEHWDNLFFELKQIDALGSQHFSKKLHRELLRQFGYKDKYLSRPRPLKNPPIRAGVVAFIVEEMGWDKSRVSRKTYRQRQWIEVRAGLREPNIKPRKRQKSNGCVIWAIVFIVLFLIFT